MKEACNTNKQIKTLIEKNVKILKAIDSWIDSDVAKPFKTKISFCAGLSINYKNNAVYYPEMDKFLDAFESKQKTYDNMKKIVSNYQ